MILSKYFIGNIFLNEPELKQFKVFLFIASTVNFYLILIIQFDIHHLFAHKWFQV